MEKTIVSLWTRLFTDGFEYVYDAVQRFTLFGDVITKRGNNYLDHLKQGQPPVLVFDYEIISDGRDLERPVNYQLVRIIDKRTQTSAHNHDNQNALERREHKQGLVAEMPHPRKRPIVVMDPRAGHGPGIGGSRTSSQIGTALTAGHPVYFILFLPDPVTGQTIADVQRCQVHFLKEVALRHPQALKPAVIGNCQAGWAAALIAADQPGVTGPLVLNGSPMSYWSGIRGANPMRYRGGLFGGSWPASLSSDLGNGRFDGAHLVAGFEELNTANTFWTKQYNLYSRIDTEAERFLTFEKWWGGFYFLSTEEINFIVSNLFISDQLQQGVLQLSEDAYINLKNFKDPIVVFASKGDDITPPQQALNWISKVYKSVEEIKRCGQTIIYMVHESIGHLGIFVSSKVNQKEHKGIIGSIDAIDFLAPGLYEMVIKKQPGKSWGEGQQVEFVRRTMDDIHIYDDGREDETVFEPVIAVSRFNEKVYQEYVSPFVRMFSSDLSAEFLRQLHPLRVQRYGFSDLNPFMIPFKIAAPVVKSRRRPASPDNMFFSLEQKFSTLMVNALELYQQNRDALLETMFYTFYDNPWIKALFSDGMKVNKPEEFHLEPDKSDMFKELENQLWLNAMKKGGFEEAIIRINLAVTNAGHVINMAEYDMARFSMKTDKRLRNIELNQLKQMIKDQAALLEKDTNMALVTLCDLLPESKDRKAAVSIAGKIAEIEAVKRFRKTAVFRKIESILLLDEIPEAVFSG